MRMSERDETSTYTLTVLSRSTAEVESSVRVDERPRLSWVRAGCLGFALLGLSRGAAQAQVVTEFSTGITGGATPTGITTGSDGNLWFTEQAASRIGRITPLGILTEFSTGITTASNPTGIAVGSDGNLWFTEQTASRIGRITPLGVVTEFSAGISASAGSVGITGGPDGNLWFTEANGNRIGRITPLGVVTEFNTGLTPAARPGGITAGPDGNLWFTEFDGNRVGRITPLGVVTEFSAGISAIAGPDAIAAGPDGNLWFTESYGNRVGRITPLGVVTEFSAGISASAGLVGITAGPDGNMWLTEAFGNRIGRITPLGVVTEFASFGVFAIPNKITAGPDGGMWFTVIGNGTSGDAIGRITTGPVSATSFHTTAPCRVLDTRSATSALGGPALAAGAKRDFVVTGTCGIPAAAVSICANVTITEPTAAATLFTLPAQFPVLAFQAGTTRANNAFLLLASDGSGTLSFSNDLPSGTVQLVVDVNGWWQ
jgi:streptogramin lyase